MITIRSVKMQSMSGVLSMCGLRRLLRVRFMASSMARVRGALSGCWGFLVAVTVRGSRCRRGAFHAFRPFVEVRGDPFHLLRHQTDPPFQPVIGHQTRD